MVRSTILAGGLLLFAGSPCLGQTETQPAAPPSPAAAVIAEQDRRQMLSTDLIGADVLNPQDGRVGTLESLLFDSEDRIVGGIVSVGGFLGIGAKSVALSWDAFAVRSGGREVFVSLTREQLEIAPSFKDLSAIGAEEDAERVRRQMQQQPAGQPAESPAQ